MEYILFTMIIFIVCFYFNRFIFSNWSNFRWVWNFSLKKMCFTMKAKMPKINFQKFLMKDFLNIEFSEDISDNFNSLVKTHFFNSNPFRGFFKLPFPDKTKFLLCWTSFIQNIGKCFFLISHNFPSFSCNKKPYL